jgi:DNA-directed RNA polymerase specialized sigma subunit
MRNELAPYIPELDKPLERTAMHLRYIEGRSVREIAYQLAYSEQHMFRVLDQAEKKIAGM